MGVDFAANASSKAIKESVVLSAAPDDANPTYAISVNASNQYEYTFNYSGNLQSINLPAGKYKLEAWGAQGGLGTYTIAGGRGGYSYGTLEITSAKTLYVAVGGKGADKLSKTTAPASGGGWNGGGHTISASGTGGGGATHIATTSRSDGQLKNYESYKTELLVVAGGGGGGAYEAEPYLGGGGGGKNGGQSGSRGGYLNGVEPGYNYESSCHGLGGTTTAPGGHVNKSGTHSDAGAWSSCSNGSFGQGGNGAGSGGGGGGGGGGYFGGGGGLINGGGGGSGYVNTTNATYKITDYGGSATDAAVRDGDGLAKITDLTKCATQSSIPTYTLTRHDTKTLTFAGTNSDNSLLGVDPSNLALSAHTNYIYQVNGIANTATQETLRARTWTDAEKADAAANSWLTYSFTTNGVTLQPTRYWTGTKAFFVRVKNTHGSPSWFRFNASVEGGELKKDKTLPSTLSDNKFGKSTTQVPTHRSYGLKRLIR